WTRRGAIAVLREVVEQELGEHVLFLPFLLVLGRGGGRRRRVRCRRRLRRLGGRRLRSRRGPPERVCVGEEALLHLVRVLAEDHGLHVVLGAHLLQRVGG